MQSHKHALKAPVTSTLVTSTLVAALTLLLAACAPATTAQTPTVAPTNPVAPTIAIDTPAAGTATPIVTLGSTDPTTATLAPTVAPTLATTAITPTVAQGAAATSAQPPVGIAAASAQGAAYDNRTSPVDLLAAYYDAINRQEYERAYNYWETAPLDYNAFAAGYADTASVQLIVQPPIAIEGAAGSLYAAIPTFLIAQHTDGSTHSFAGCIVTRKSNVEPFETPEGNPWYLYQARLGEVANNANIPAQLASACAS